MWEVEAVEEKTEGVWGGKACGGMGTFKHPEMSGLISKRAHIIRAPLSKTTHD